MGIDYTYFYKRKFNNCSELVALPVYDVFISFYNNSDRLLGVFKEIRANTKWWLYSDQYPYNSLFFLPTDKIEIYNISIEEESELIADFFDKSKIFPRQNICIDITGFRTPQLIFLIKFLKENHFKKFDIIYSEPDYYADREKTVFSANFHHVRQIHGYEGNHNTDVSNDVLIIGSGYDDGRITDVANNKAKARKIQLFGFPSLQPDMYQENVLKAYKAESAVGGHSFIDSATNIYAPAEDPFVAAQMIKGFIERENSIRKITNLYLSPISTKAHALGMALYYLFECEGKPASIIFPFCETNYGNTSIGISKIISCTIEFP
jgi:hypothetical protein